MVSSLFLPGLTAWRGGVRKSMSRTVRLAIAGSDYPADSGTTQLLKKHSREFELDENVLFTGQRADVASLLAACDIFSLPSFEEPFGLVFAEAMAMKRPVVALTNGGTPEVVEHGKCGLLSRPGDIDALAANLIRLLDDPALRARLRIKQPFTPQPRFIRASWTEATCFRICPATY